MHLHKWKLVEFNHVESRDISFGVDMASVTHYTRLLYSCTKCSKFKTKKIKGIWDFTDSDCKEATDA